jgi:AraC family transcriptional regulator, positive regulator of tynA and feaB
MSGGLGDAMAQLLTFEAGDSNLSERFRAISGTISENFFAPHFVQPVGERHRPAVMNWAYTDGAIMSRAQMSPLYNENRTARSRNAGKYLVWQANQASRLKLAGRAPLHLLPDEFVLLTSDMATEWLVPHEFTTSCLIIDNDLFNEQVPQAADLLGRRLNFPFGLDAVLRAMFESAWAITCAGQFADLGRHIVRAVLQTLSAVPANQPEHGPRRTHLEIRHAQVRRFIEQNYARPDLSIASIASCLNLSQRYVQLAFKSERMTPSEYLRNCRLTAAAQLLCDPAHCTRTITEIAFACGFNSAAHFSSEFKQAYGMSPRDFRSGARDNADGGCR